MEILLFSADVRALEDPILFRALYEAVSACRKEKVDRIRTRAGKLLTLGAGGLLEAAMAELGIFAPRILLGPNEKPYLADRCDLFFNLSHSGTKVLCAISDHEIGCDVEQLREARLALAKRCFCPEEYQAILRCADAEARRRLFYRFWTLKESFLKATGLGLRLPLNAFQLHPLNEPIRVTQQVDKRQYSFFTLLSDDYAYALCSVDRPIEKLTLRPRDFGSLTALLCSKRNQTS